MTTTQEPEEREARLDPEQSVEWGDTPLTAPVREEETEQEEVETEEAEETDELVEEDEEQVEEEHEEAAPLLTATNPGDYVEKDYSFEITLNGSTTKIETIEQAEKFADEHAEEFTAKELLAFTRKANKMENNLERDREDYERKREAFEAEKANEEARQESINSIANEINYLVAKGKLPKVPKEYQNADWSDPKVASQTGVKEQVSLLTYMRSENDARQKAGLKPITSALDAYNAWQLEQMNNDEQDTKKQRAAARKQAGARIAGSSSNPVNIAPKGIAVGRALNLGELDSF